MSGFSLQIVQTLAGRIVRERKGEPSATRAAGPGELDEPGLHAALARWGINPAVWLAQFQQLDRQCMRALGTAERVVRRAQEVAQQRLSSCLRGHRKVTVRLLGSRHWAAPVLVRAIPVIRL